jgi:hypothetical protein
VKPWTIATAALIGGLAFGSQGGCVQRLLGPKLTGTCDGACAHYVSCKPGHPDADRTRCRAECPNVLTDEDSLMMYESMSCRDAVEYVDGIAPKTSSR